MSTGVKKEKRFTVILVVPTNRGFASQRVYVKDRYVKYRDIKVLHVINSCKKFTDRKRELTTKRENHTKLSKLDL